MDDAQAVYAAEDVWENQEEQARIKFGDWQDVRPFYVELARRFREAGEKVYPPTVKARNGALKAHYDGATKTVHIPPYSRGGAWALNTGTAIHEFAHHLSPGAGHGPAFREAMVRCLEVLGWNPEVLVEAYAKVGLSASAKGSSMTDKVSKLLTHADKAGTDAERQTYIEKAERMAAEHSINLAMIRKRQADEDSGERSRPITSDMFSLTALANVTLRNLAVELASAITCAHGARLTIRGKSQYLTFYGFAEDVALTKLMIERVTPMMFEEAEAYVASPERKASGEAAVSARIDFCKSFTIAVGSRIREAVAVAEKEVAETLAITDGSPVSTELVLREKAIEVADYVKYEFKRQGVRGSWKGSSGKYSAGARSAGRTSGQQANLYGRRELG